MDKLLYLVLFSFELRDKRNFKELQFWSESLGAVLEYTELLEEAC